MYRKIFLRYTWLGFLLCFLIFIFGYMFTMAADVEDSLDFTTIQKAMDDMMPEEMNLTFSDIVDQLKKGELKTFLEKMGSYVIDSFFLEVRNSKNLLVQIIGIVIVSAVFTNFSMAFSKTHIAETGYYLTYMILFTLLLTSFSASLTSSAKILGQMTRFMSVLVPVFSLAVMMTGNIQTGLWYHQAMIVAVAAIQWFISKGMLSCVKCYVILSMVNQLSKEDVLSKCTEMIKTVTSWVMKTAVGCILGLNLIQGIVLPAFDSLKNGWTSRVISSIPGVGDAMGGVIQTLGGSAVLIKNSVGAGGLLILSLLFFMPSMKLAVMILMYMGSQVILQPVADKRTIECLHALSDGLILLLKIGWTVFVLFFLSLAMMISLSGTVFGG